MKKIMPVLALFLLLSACRNGPKPDEIAHIYSAATELSAQMSICAHSNVIVEYDLSYRLSGGVAEVTFLRPQALEGVSARLTPGSATIFFDGVSAETLLPGIPGMTPVDAFHGLLADLAKAVPLDMGVQNGLAALTYCGEYDGLPLEKRVWLDEQTLAVTACEFFVDGRMVMRMDISAINIF